MDKETTYYIYHIPGKKIGVTRNLLDRVTHQQGYKPSEYEVLESSEDINYISDREIELLKSYGYKVDRKLYKNLFEKMKINATQETSTFPFPLSELKRSLIENLGETWETTLGTEGRKRSIYTFQRRSLNMPLLETFDAPVLNSSCEFTFTLISGA